jgi:hypothetical protein
MLFLKLLLLLVVVMGKVLASSCACCFSEAAAAGATVASALGGIGVGAAGDAAGSTLCCWSCRCKRLLSSLSLMELRRRSATVFFFFVLLLLLWPVAVLAAWVLEGSVGGSLIVTRFWLE